ncbi:MAG: hypothetical protein E6G66_16810, partial [Actinobacteria bacterium]
PAEAARREAAEGVVRSIAAAGVQAIVVTSAVQATNLFSVARALGVEDDLRRSLTERIFTAAVGQVSKAALEREGVPVDFVSSPARLGALIRGLAASSAPATSSPGARSRQRRSPRAASPPSGRRPAKPRPRWRRGCARRSGPGTRCRSSSTASRCPA